MKRIISTLLALCLCAALACPAFAADHELNKDNNWNIDGQLIMPGDTITTVVYKEVSEVKAAETTIRTDVTFDGASLSMANSFSSDNDFYLKDGHTLQDLSGFTPSTPESVDVIGLAADGIDALAGVGPVQASWTKRFTNNTGFPVVIHGFNGDTTQHYHAEINGMDIYVFSYENNRPNFTAYEPSYSLEYRDMDMAEEELAKLPDRYYISNEELTLTLPTLQKDGYVFRGYYGVPGVGKIDPGGNTITYTYDWEWLKAAEVSSDYSFEDHTVTPEFFYVGDSDTMVQRAIVALTHRGMTVSDNNTGFDVADYDADGDGIVTAYDAVLFLQNAVK